MITNKQQIQLMLPDHKLKQREEGGREGEGGTIAAHRPSVDTWPVHIAQLTGKLTPIKPSGP